MRTKFPCSLYYFIKVGIKFTKNRYNYSINGGIFMREFYSEEISRNIWLKDKEKLILQGLQKYNIARIELNSLSKELFITTKTLRSYLIRLEELGFISGVRIHNAIATFKVIRPSDAFTTILSEYYHCHGGHEKCKREKKKPTIEEAKAFYEGEESDVGLLPKKPTKTIEKPRNIDVKKPHSKVLPSTKRVTSFMDKPVTEWSSTDFVTYHSQKYLNAVGFPHPTSRKHIGMAKNIVNKYGHEQVKLYIDTFFEMGFDNRTFNMLASGSYIGHIQTYLSTGKLPFFINQPNKDIQETYPAQEKLDEDSRERAAIFMAEEWSNLDVRERALKEKDLKETDHQMYISYLFYKEKRIGLDEDEKRILYPFANFG